MIYRVFEISLDKNYDLNKVFFIILLTPRLSNNVTGFFLITRHYSNEKLEIIMVFKKNLDREICVTYKL